MKGVSAGMCGVNIGVPVPREPFGFGGWNDSKFDKETLLGGMVLDSGQDLVKSPVNGLYRKMPHGCPNQFEVRKNER